MYLSTHFLADVYVGKIHVNILKTQYSVLNKIMCMHTVHFTAYGASVCWQSN